jgi:glycosyltransferase involved in cell wall biosynthesis
MKKMNQLISIIIPLYNKELYIKRTLDSVLSQTHTNFECIIVDSSNDGSTEIVKRYSDPRIIHIISPSRIVQSKARNIGIQKSRSEFIAFLDADDEWLPDHLEALFMMWEKFPEAGLFSTPYIKIRDNGVQRTMIFAEIPPPPWSGYIHRYFRICSKGDVPVHSSSCAIRKDIFYNIGGFDERYSEVKKDEHVWAGEDHHLWARIALHYPVVFTWDSPIIYHTEASGRICNQLKKQIIPDPLNSYLEDFILSEKVSYELKQDIEAYIKRRKKTLSAAACITKKVSTDNTKDNNSLFNFCSQTLNSLCLGSILSSVIQTTYNSRMYNWFIWIWCLLHGWHTPKLNK